MTGAAIALVLFLGYVLLVQAMTAAIVLLCEFTIIRIQALRAFLKAAEPPQAAPQAPVLVEPKRPTYRLGGDVRWH
jgi:hypothetical protein